jgi:hypothetical protein
MKLIPLFEDFLNEEIKSLTYTPFNFSPGAKLVLEQKNY